MTDQNSQFFAILTKVGEAKQANADALGLPWKITHMAVGDANGTEPMPDRLQEALINERRRAPLNQLSVDPDNASMLTAEQIIPANEGGWWIREIGLFDEDGDLVAVANCAPSYKPQLTQGAGRTQIVRMSFIVTSAASVQLKIDPSVVLASRDWVEKSFQRAIYVAPLTGAVQRAIVDRLGDRVSVMDFGAVGDGVADDTAALQAAVNSGRSVFVPKGTYRLTATIAAPAVMIYGEGTQSILKFDSIGAGTDGLVFTPTLAEQTSGCRDLAILVAGTNGGAAIKTPRSSIQYLTYRSKFHFSRLLISGAEKPASGTGQAFETVTGWSVGISQGDAWNVEIYEVDGYSTYRADTDPAAQLASTFIRLDAENGMLTAHVGSITCSNWYRGIEIGERCFFQIQRFDIAHAHDGVYQTAEVLPFNESKLLDGNINAQRYGVLFKNLGARQIGGVIVRRHRKGWKGAAHDWHGFYLEGCDGVWLTDCHAQPDESEGAFAGTQNAVSLKACGAVHVSGLIVGAPCDNGLLADNCTMLMANSTMTWQNTPGAALFRLANNTRTSTLGEYTLVSSFAGNVYADDGTIGDSVQFHGRDVKPVGALPIYYWRRPGSAADEKLWRAVAGPSNWGLQASTDSESSNVNALLITRSGTTAIAFDIRATETITRALNPDADNVRSSGSASKRWAQVYAGTATINTSDEREKEDIEDIPDAVLDAWASVSWLQFRFVDGVRTHAGLVAQRVKAAFEGAGIDPFKYGILCYDEWKEQAETLDEEGQVLTPYKAAGNRYGVRYEEAFALEVALQRRTTQRLEARLGALEAQ